MYKYLFLALLSVTAQAQVSAVIVNSPGFTYAATYIIPTRTVQQCAGIPSLLYKKKMMPPGTSTSYMCLDDNAAILESGSCFQESTFSGAPKGAVRCSKD